MRIPLSIPAVVAASALLSACNSAASLYASGPWAPGVGVVRAVPGYGGPMVSPKPYALDTLQDIEPGVYPRPVAPGRIELDVPAAPPPVYGPAPYASAPAYSEPAIGAPPAVATTPLSATPAPSQQASLPPAAVVATPSTRPSSYAGSWKAVDAQGSACRVQLSSSPTLDLYKASASGCANAKLSSVNAWNLREGSVILFSRGNVVARLQGPEASLAGSFTSGDALKMTR